MREPLFAFSSRPIQITPVRRLPAHRCTKRCSINVRIKIAIPADVAPAETATLCLVMGCALRSWSNMESVSTDLVAISDVVVVEGLRSRPLRVVGAPFVISGFPGTIFNDVDVVLFSFVGLADVVPLDPEPHISSVLAEFLDREDGVLLGGRARAPLSCSLRTVGVEELMRTVSPSVMAFNDPPL